MLNNIATATALKEEGKTLLVNNVTKNGMPAWSDNLAITAEGGANKDDAVYKFINKSLTPTGRRASSPTAVTRARSTTNRRPPRKPRNRG